MRTRRTALTAALLGAVLLPTLAALPVSAAEPLAVPSCTRPAAALLHPLHRRRRRRRHPRDGVRRRDGGPGRPAGADLRPGARRWICLLHSRYHRQRRQLRPAEPGRRSTIVPTATTRTPPVQGKVRNGFALIVSAGAPPAGGWPVAVYGPGFTRSHFDLFVTADLNAAAGITTIATNPLGHGYGPASTITVDGLPAASTFLSCVRGRDLTGDGVSEAAEGSQPATAVTSDAGDGSTTEQRRPTRCTACAAA